MAATETAAPVIRVPVRRTGFPSLVCRLDPNTEKSVPRSAFRSRRAPVATWCRPVLVIFLASTMFYGFVNDKDYGRVLAPPPRGAKWPEREISKNITSTGRHRAFSLADPGREKCALDPFEMRTACRLVLALGRDFGRLPEHPPRTPNFGRISEKISAVLRCVAFAFAFAFALRCVASRCVALRCVALRCVALRCVAMCCVAVRCVVLCCVVLRRVVSCCVVLG